MATINAILDSSTVAIAGLVGGEFTNFGSGVCVQVGPRHFIATAAHVITPLTNEQIFVVHADSPTSWTPEICGRGEAGDPYDVAWIELAPDCVERFPRRFLPVDRLTNPSDVRIDELVLYGFPGASLRHDLLSRRTIGAQRLSYLTRPVSPEEPDYDPERDLFLHYPEQGNFTVEGRALERMTDPQGLSGCGAWSVHPKTSPIWTPEDCKLLAIQYSWQEGEWCRCTLIRHWIALLVSDLPELEAHVPARLIRA